MAKVNKQAVAAALVARPAAIRNMMSCSAAAPNCCCASGEERFFPGARCRLRPGSMSRYWREAGSEVTALDLSAGMLAQAQRNGAAQHYLQGDIEALPLPDACFDLAWSNLAVQWCDELSAQWRAVPGGAARRASSVHHVARRIATGTQSSVAGVDDLPC